MCIFYLFLLETSFSSFSVFCAACSFILFSLQNNHCIIKIRFLLIIKKRTSREFLGFFKKIYFMLSQKNFLPSIKWQKLACVMLFIWEKNWCTLIYLRKYPSSVLILPFLSLLCNDSCNWALMNIKQHYPVTFLSFFVKVRVISKRVDQIKPASIPETHHFTLKN